MKKFRNEMTEKEISNSVNNGLHGAYGSGGCMNNPMYRNVCAKGRYEQISGREKRRYWERRRKKEARKEKRLIQKLGNFIT